MTNPWVADTPASPISQVRDWMAGRTEGGRQPLIDVSQAAPGYPPAPQLREHLASLDWTGAARYGPVLGQPELRAALADDISAVYRAPVRPEQTAVTAGANQAFCLAVNVLCRARGAGHPCPSPTTSTTTCGCASAAWNRFTCPPGTT